jgi:hypothetical protein
MDGGTLPQSLPARKLGEFQVYGVFVALSMLFLAG